MTTEVIVAMIASGGGLLGSAIGVIASSRLTNYRIGQLEEKVNKQVLKNMLGWLANSESSFLMKRKH